MVTFAALLAAVLRDPDVAAALRDALGGGRDEAIPLATVAAELGVRPRVLRDAARRGELRIEGPRTARVVRRSERDRWLASNPVRRTRPKTTTPVANDTEETPAEAGRAAVAREAARVAR